MKDKIKHSFVQKYLDDKSKGSLVIVNAILMFIAWFFPKPAVFLYLTLPIISFFKPEKR